MEHCFPARLFTDRFSKRFKSKLSLNKETKKTENGLNRKSYTYENRELKKKTITKKTENLSQGFPHGSFFYSTARRENTSFLDSCLDFRNVRIFGVLKPGQAHPLRPRARRWTLFQNFVFPKVPKKCHKSLIFCCPIFVPIYISELNYEKKRKDMSYQWSFRTSSIPVVHL